jgi:hypothetical protein
MVITRITDFIPSTLIESQEVDDEFNQLVNLLSGVSTNKDTLLKFSDGTNPVLRVDQLGAGKIQQWLQNGSEKARIDNDGSAAVGALNATLNHATNPAVNVNQVGAGLIQRWQQNGADRATLSALGRLLLPAGVGAAPSTDQISNFGTYFSDAADRATGANTTETDFSSKTVAANVLAADGDFFILLAEILYANNANTKRYRLYFGGTTVYDTTGAAFGNGGNQTQFLISLFYRKTSSSLFIANLSLIGNALLGVTINTGSAAPNFAVSNILKSTGQNGTASAGDITQRIFVLLKGSV